jgi:exopolyphosphatase / guanosine-5'-triphosphate,3'-diphosphate pyrophosphatase
VIRQVFRGLRMGRSPSATDDPQVIGFIDIGTNSIRMLLVRIHPNLSYTVLAQRKEVVRLGEGLFESDTLQNDAMDRAILVCQKFTQMATAQDANLISAVATSATREAQNQGLFLRRLQDEANLDARVISGVEEARLIYLGVVSDINLGDNLAGFIDIGGGSTEIIVGDQNTHLSLETTKLGAIRLSRLLHMDHQNPVSAEEYTLLKSYVRDSGARALQQSRRFRMDLAVGSSGTIENLGDITARMFWERSREPDDTFTRQQLRKVIKQLCELTLKERREIAGINPERADIIIAGAAILETLLEDLEIPEFRISERSLKDGLLIDHLANMGTAPDEELPFRTTSIMRLGRSLDFDEEHARRVANFSLELFDSAQAQKMINLGEWERELLQYASLLHDIGVALSYTNHQAHSYYFIRNADLLGFDQKEIAIIAATARFHRKSFPRKKHPEFAELDEAAQEIVRVLCTLLSIAESLDRSHSALVKRARFRVKNKSIIELLIYSDQEAQLEVWGVEFHQKAFQKVFGRKLKVRQMDGILQPNEE